MGLVVCPYRVRLANRSELGDGCLQHFRRGASVGESDGSDDGGDDEGDAPGRPSVSCHANQPLDAILVSHRSTALASPLQRLGARCPLFVAAP